MSNTDTSSSARTRQRKAQALAAYSAANPGANEGGRLKSTDSSAHTARVPGAYPVVRVVDSKPAVVTDGCCACVALGAPTNINVGNPYGSDNTITNPITWTPVEGATSYTLTSSWPSAVFTEITNSSALMTYEWVFPDPDPTFTITAIGPCGSATSAVISAFPCFLAGSLVAMADGTSKAIEDVRVGDAVIGAFGEINYILALHRPILGNRHMIRINDEHSSTSHHPHISADKKFYCDNINELENNTYGRDHDVLDATGATVTLMLHGLRKGRVQKYELGIMLQTTSGPRALETLTYYDMCQFTQLYNLVVSGSHTYCVDGYAVTGWPREDDFDYDTWTSIPSN